MVNLLVYLGCSILQGMIMMSEYVVKDDLNVGYVGAGF